MLDKLLISPAYAQDSLEQMEAVAGPSALVSIIPFVLIFAVFYFLVIRPQQKRLVEQDKLVRSIKAGDKIVFSGGIHGKVKKVDELAATAVVEIASGVELTIERDAILSLENKQDPVKK